MHLNAKSLHLLSYEEWKPRLLGNLSKAELFFKKKMLTCNALPPVYWWLNAEEEKKKSIETLEDAVLKNYHWRYQELGIRNWSQSYHLHQEKRIFQYNDVPRNSVL